MNRNRCPNWAGVRSVSAGTQLTATGTDASNNTSEFSGLASVATISADVQTTKTGATTVLAGSNLVYTITVTNLGPSTASDVVVLDTIPTNSVFVSASSGGSYSNGVVTWSSLTNFANAAGTNFTITVTAPAIGPITNTVSSTASTSDPDASNNNGTAAEARVTSTVLLAVSGTVFEDLNYGGGAGRSLAASSGVGVAGARVELFDGAGNFITFTNTSAGGTYSFAVSSQSNYTVRVVNDSVPSTRSGWSAGLLPVQTFRTTATNGSAVAVTDYVGGEVPFKSDAGNGSTTLAALTTATTAPQSVTAVTLTTNSLSGLEFGFNFDTIVNTNNTGQGSLRQFILNARALGTEGSLAQSGSRLNLGVSEALPAGKESSIFMISDGAAHPGLRAGLANQLSSGVAVIRPTSALTPISTANGANTILDGTTQTANVGDSNPGQLGAGGTVGVDALALPTVPRPEVQIRDGANVRLGLQVQANNVTIRGLAIYGFGNNAYNDGDADLRINNNASGVVIEQNILGTSATSFTDPGASARSDGDHLRVVSGNNGIARNNLIGFGASSGIAFPGGIDGWLIEANELRGDCIPAGQYHEVDMGSCSGNTVRGNLMADTGSSAIHMYNSTGRNTIVNNTIRGTGGLGSVENPGIVVESGGDLYDRNVIAENKGAGVLVVAGYTGNKFTRNSFYDNGADTASIGIDLLAPTDDSDRGTSPFVSINDASDVDAGGNDLINYPVLTSAVLSGTNLVVSGYVRAGQGVEFFIANPHVSGFGEGETYLFTGVEGSVDDSDGGTGTYGPGVINGLTQGTDTANEFTFTVALPAGVSVGTQLTATATDGSDNTSEFSGMVTVASVGADVATTKSGATNVVAGSNLVYTITVTNLGPSTASNVVVLDIIPTNSVFVSATGGGSFSGGVVTWNGLTNFAAATGTNFTVTVTAPSMDGSMTNIVSSTADTPDPDSSNNDGSAAGARVITTVTLSGVNVTGWVYLDANRNGFKDGSEAGTGLSLYAKLIAGTNTPGPALQAVTVDGGSGLYIFTNVIAGAYKIVIDDNSTLADVTPALPSGWTGTEMSGQMRTNVVVVSVNVPNQNFGLANSVTLSGRVFKDTGDGGTANDGVLNGAEEAISGVVVKLTDDSGATTYDTATTDGGGRYTLHIPGSVPNGTVLKVVETNPGGHLSTGASAGNTGGSYDRFSDTLTFTLTSGTVYTGVDFGDVPENSFVAAGQQTGPAGSFVIFAHSYTAGSAGQLTFTTTSVSSPSVAGWNAVVYRDANCNGVLDSGEPVVSAPITVTAGEKICLVVKEFIPLAAPMNARDQLTVTANLSYSGATPALTNAVALTDLTTVGLAGTAGLTLLKSVDKETALPGEIITYTITYENRGAEALGNVVIFDQTPAFTTFTSAANGVLPGNLTSVATITPAVGDAGAVHWTFTGTLSPGSSGAVTYRVKVNQ